MNALKSVLALVLLIFPIGLKAQNISVSGRVEGITSGNILLIAQPHETQLDTIADAPISNGYFKVTASITEPQALRIAVKGYEGGFTLLAEPDAIYKAQLADGMLRVVWGAPLQDTYNDLLYADVEKGKIIEELNTKYDALKQEGKFRSASRVNDTIVMVQTARRALHDSIYAANDNLLPAYNAWFNISAGDKSLADCREAYNQLGTSAKTSQAGRLIKERIDRLAQTEEGRTAPDFELEDLNGNTLRMSDVEAKLIIIDFWASWCGPCRLNNPLLKRLYAEYHSKGLEIIAVSLDEDKAAWKMAVEKQDLPWIHVSSLKGWKCPVAQMYAVTAVPAMFVVDKNNRIIATQLRGEALENFLANYMKENNP